MVSKAFDWINTLATVWKVLFGVIVGVAIASASVATAYAVLKADNKALKDNIQAVGAASLARDDALEGRTDNLEKHKDQNYEDIVIRDEKLRLAREKIHAAEALLTNEYRKEMRDRMRQQENDTSGMKAMLEQMDKRIP